MEFTKKAEQFISHLTHCLAIEPEPVVQLKERLCSLMLEPDIFFRLIKTWNVDYPFIPENEIIELKTLMKVERIDANDALSIIENFKTQYWIFDAVTICQPVIDKLERTLRNLDSEISQQEINLEVLHFRNHLLAKRERIYVDLVNELQGLASLGSEVETEQGQSNTFCNSMSLSIPKEHFKVLTEKKSKNGQPFLTNEQFALFIERAFCSNAEIPKQKINQVPKGEKLLIQKVFYEFYDNYCMEYFSSMQCQDVFIKLLTDNFIGWDFQNVKNNFTPKTKKRF